MRKGQGPLCLTGTGGEAPPTPSRGHGAPAWACVRSAKGRTTPGPLQGVTWGGSLLSLPSASLAPPASASDWLPPGKGLAPSAPATSAAQETPEGGRAGRKGGERERKGGRDQTPRITGACECPAAGRGRRGGRGGANRACSDITEAQNTRRTARLKRGTETRWSGVEQSPGTRSAPIPSQPAPSRTPPPRPESSPLPFRTTL